MNLSKDQWLQTSQKEKQPDIMYFLTELYNYLYSLEPEIRLSLEIYWSIYRKYKKYRKHRGIYWMTSWGATGKIHTVENILQLSFLHK